MSMNEVQLKEAAKVYCRPFVRAVGLTQEYSFLQSSLEAIAGGDNPDIPW